MAREFFVIRIREFKIKSAKCKIVEVKMRIIMGRMPMPRKSMATLRFWPCHPPREKKEGNRKGCPYN
jgi:hypothetical protein